MNRYVPHSVLVGSIFGLAVTFSAFAVDMTTPSTPGTPITTPASPVVSTAAPPCIEFVSSIAYDTAGNRILRFTNKCSEGLFLKICLKNAAGVFNNFLQWIAPNQTFDLHVEPNLPDQTFNYSWDPKNPSDPSPCGCNEQQVPTPSVAPVTPVVPVTPATPVMPVTPVKPVVK